MVVHDRLRPFELFTESGSGPAWPPASSTPACGRRRSWTYDRAGRPGGGREPPRARPEPQVIGPADARQALEVTAQHIAVVTATPEAEVQAVQA